jgi:hypothetical protein
LFSCYGNIDPKRQWKPGHDVLDIRPGGPTFERDGIAMNNSRGNTPESRIAERHVIDRATHVDGGEAWGITRGSELSESNKGRVMQFEWNQPLLL